MEEIKKILLADDDEAIADSMILMLEINGYEVLHVFNGYEVNGALHDLPSLIILDVWMSGTDGRDVCRQLKSDPATSHVPILMMSASRDIRPSALEAGADDFIEKPFDMGILIGKIVALAG